MTYCSGFGKIFSSEAQRKRAMENMRRSAKVRYSTDGITKKACEQCGVVKPLEDFPRSWRAPTGGGKCTACANRRPWSIDKATTKAMDKFLQT